MRVKHSGTFVENQLPALASRSARPLQRIAASACPLCDFESVVRRRTDPMVITEPLTVKMQVFRNHLGRHLEQLALFVLPKEEVIERKDDTANSAVATAAEDRGPWQVSDSDESEGDLSSPKVSSESNDSRRLSEDSTTDADPAKMVSMLMANDNLIAETEDLQDNVDSVPDLAFVWMPPMDFTPPEKDFEVEDEDLIPRREEPMFGGDIYTPGWVRGYGKTREAFCGRCNPGVWHNIDDLSYEKNLTYMHGIASTGLSLPRPSSLRQVNGKSGIWQGYCDSCHGWRDLRKSSAGWNWYRHCMKVRTNSCD